MRYFSYASLTANDIDPREGHAFEICCAVAEEC